MATHRIGRLPFSLLGSDQILPPIESELRRLQITDQPSKPRVTYRFARPTDLVDVVKVGSLILTDHGYGTEHNRIRYTARASAGPLEVDLASAMTTWKHRIIPGPLAKFQDRAYLDPTENTAKAFLYNIFDYTTQLAGLSLGQSWLHASAVCRDEIGLALIAWGGVGKTSTMLDLVMRHGWSYLSDDLALLCSDGTLHRSPKHLQVYGYNLQADDLLRRRLLRDRLAVDRGSWAIRERTLGPHRVRRRVPASWLFEELEPVTSAPLRHAFFLRSTDGNRLVAEPADKAWVASRAATILLEELKPFLSLSVAANSMMDHSVLLSPERFVAQTGQVILDGLADAETLLLDVPKGTAPDEISRVVLRAIDA